MRPWALARPWSAFKYEVDAPGGIDINATYDGLDIFEKEQEIVFPGGIRAQNIKGAWELDQYQKPVRWIPNPRYHPDAAPSLGP